MFSKTRTVARLNLRGDFSDVDLNTRVAPPPSINLGHRHLEAGLDLQDLLCKRSTGPRPWRTPLLVKPSNPRLTHYAPAFARLSCDYPLHLK